MSLREVKENLSESTQSVNGKFRIKALSYRVPKSVLVIVTYVLNIHMPFTCGLCGLGTPRGNAV